MAVLDYAAGESTAAKTASRRATKSGAAIGSPGFRPTEEEMTRAVEREVDRAPYDPAGAGAPTGRDHRTPNRATKC